MLTVDFGFWAGPRARRRLTQQQLQPPQPARNVRLHRAEQLQGRLHSTASDVYSFGIVWFEMLTGELPFACSASSPMGTALARLKGSAPAPSSRNPLVPGYLDAVVLGCLRRSPKDRFRSAAEALRALDTLELRAQSTFQKRKLVPLSVAAVCWAPPAPTWRSSLRTESRRQKRRSAPTCPRPTRAT